MSLCVSDSESLDIDYKALSSQLIESSNYNVSCAFNVVCIISVVHIKIHMAQVNQWV